jgi:NAD(P)-dependent dehydrogenase (short-subunit alcohol dehydrogenase family)
MKSDRTLDARAAGARRFEGKICVVAGAGQGIGSATARRLAQEGGTLVLGDWVEASAQRVADEITNFGGTASIHAGNYSTWDDAKSLMDVAVQRHGRIDTLVVIVGGTIFFQSFQLYTPEQIEAEVNKSFWPTIWCVRAALPAMIAQHSGSIVTLSTHAIVGKFRAPYAAAKGGVVGLTLSLAQELGQHGIRINCVAPSATGADDRVTPRNYQVDVPRTELPAEEQELQRRYREGGRTSTQPLVEGLGRQARSEDQAAAIAFLASDDAAFVTGEVVSVGGGETLPF